MHITVVIHHSPPVGFEYLINGMRNTVKEKGVLLKYP